MQALAPTLTVIIIVIIQSMLSLQLVHSQPNRHELKYHRYMVQKISQGQFSWAARFNPAAALQNCSKETQPKHGFFWTPKTDPLLGPHFDSREKWPFCRLLQQPAIHQGACGSCWAVGTAGAISDRFCIASNGTLQPEMSVWNLLTCSGGATKSTGLCHSGYYEVAYSSWVVDGIVTGGKYGSKEGCKPYPIHARCGGPCPPSSYVKIDEKCVQKCDESYSKTYIEDTYYGTNIVIKYMDSKNPDVRSVQRAILQGGPVTGIFEVFEDVYHYSSGVYKHVTGHRCNDHIVKITGWGTEDDISYWIIANSWGESWGQEGFGKVAMGHFYQYGYGDPILPLTVGK